jgi:hypothetical protein
MADDRDSPGTLGVLQLQNTPMMFRGCLGNPETFAFPTRCLRVRGAWVSNVVPGDPAIEPSFISSAQTLEAEGVAAITTTCGFALRFQAAMASAVRIPVSTSSLVLLPTLLGMLPPGKKVGVLTFDARHFTADLLDLAGVMDPARVVVAGIEGTQSWEEMSRPDVQIRHETLERDVLATIDALREREPLVAGLLFECAGFGPVSPAARRRTGLPVHDAVTSAEFLMAGAAARVATPELIGA